MRTVRPERSIYEIDARLEEAATKLEQTHDESAHGLLRSALGELRRAEAALIQEHRALTEEHAQLVRERARYRELFERGRDALIITDLHGVVREANASAGEALRTSAAALQGSRIRNLFEDRDVARGLLLRTRTEQRIDDVRVKLAAGDEGARNALVSLRLIAPSGGLMQVAWHVRPITANARDDGWRRSAAALEERVRDSAAELERANDVRDEFLGLISHELKTPIAVIAGNAAVLARRGEELDRQERAAALNDIRSEAERLHRIVDDLLALARLERGALIGREPTDAGQIIEERVEAHRAEWPDRRFVVAVEPGLPLVDAAPVYVAQALRNLMTNAEQHSPAGAPIEVRAARDDGCVRVTVMDRGGGVAEEDVESLFMPFARMEDRNRRGRGIGLGLAVSRRLVEAQLGRMIVERREGGGMSFGFTLPAAP